MLELCGVFPVRKAFYEISKVRECVKFSARFDFRVAAENWVTTLGRSQRFNENLLRYERREPSTSKRRLLHFAIRCNLSGWNVDLNVEFFKFNFNFFIFIFTYLFA